MPAIRVLPDHVANQIAAGEVVERPAAVVKELVENAIDAGATRIEVEFRHGGRSLIRVEDNGCGMSREDARLSLERHATSKITAAADLDALATFGFRGEALPSIASVSTFQLRTCREGDPVATDILVDGGKLRHVRECGRPRGTQIIVSNLFAPVPARRKFLRSDLTESAHIIQCVRLYALAWPAIGFTLLEDGRPHLRTTPGLGLAERIAEVHGRDLAGSLLPVDLADGDFKLSGFLGGPGVHRSTRQEITCFVNRRPVDNRTMTYALVEAFSGAIPEGRYPVAVLFLELPPALVDVNVHPTKREVRFRDETRVRGLVVRAVLRALQPSDGVGASPATTSGADSTDLPPNQPAAVEGLPDSSVETVPAGATAPSRPVLPPSDGAAIPVPVFERIPGVVAAASGEAPVARSGYGRGWRWLGQALGGYCLFETAGGLVLLDHRAASERIWFEKLEREFSEAKPAGQRLLFPVAFQLEPVQTAVLEEHRSLLTRIGFEIADFGRDFFRIEAVPEWLEAAAAESFLRDCLGLAREGRLPASRPALARQELARHAAAKAIPAQAPTSSEQGLRLVEDLFRCAQPLSDAGGRPTLIELTAGEVARRFGRR